ncbi:hypothetical protein EVAR_92737_1 [Eumeta japonica]|uniref:Uncharacterized protein n=1 Tax=Eumeta variegata TaxID=151549 RepID=A0A4C1SXA4_EUMVA|nr:hypothetical protein EVAR_92737_1 [Eumeta japonica]
MDTLTPSVVFLKRYTAATEGVGVRPSDACRAARAANTVDLRFSSLGALLGTLQVRLHHGQFTGHLDNTTPSRGHAAPEDAGGRTTAIRRDIIGRRIPQRPYRRHYSNDYYYLGLTHTHTHKIVEDYQ